MGSEFNRDKRPRISRSVRASEDKGGRYTPRRDGEKDNRHSDGGKDSGALYGERRSYNPNFDRDNRLRTFDADKRAESPRYPAGRSDRETGYNPEHKAGYTPDRKTEYKPGYKTGYRSDRKTEYGPERKSDRSPHYGDKDYRHAGGRVDGNRNSDNYGNNRNNDRGGHFKGKDGNRFKGKAGGRFDSKGRKGPAAYPRGGFNSESRPESYPSFNPDPSGEPLRLNKFISRSGICSRREADEFIKQGLVTVNGEVVTEMGTKVNPGDEIKYNNKVLRGEKMVYILMNKPKGFVTTTDDPNAAQTVMDLVKNACRERVYPVGRLDKNSLGVLLITNDGELTKKLTHPSHAKKKIYEVALDKPATRADLEKLLEGVELEDGIAVADEVEYVGDSKKDVGIAIHSGRNRIVRRMFEALGYRVNKLDRVYFAGLTKKGLRRGAWRYLSLKETGMLKSGRYE